LNYRSREISETEKKKQFDSSEKGDSLREEMNSFYEKLRQHMFKKHLSLKDTILQIKGTFSYNIDSLNDNEFYVEGKEKYHSRD
jgi:hypothetical protein